MTQLGRPKHRAHVRGRRRRCRRVTGNSEYATLSRSVRSTGRSSPPAGERRTELWPTSMPRSELGNSSQREHGRLWRNETGVRAPLSAVSTGLKRAGREGGVREVRAQGRLEGIRVLRRSERPDVVPAAQDKAARLTGSGRVEVGLVPQHTVALRQTRPRPPVQEREVWLTLSMHCLHSLFAFCSASVAPTRANLLT
jgi:hypothetical protein